MNYSCHSALIHQLQPNRRKRRWSFSLVLLSLAPLLLGTPAVVHAQWGPDVRLTYCDSASWTTDNNAWCIGADTTGFVHVLWWDKRNVNDEVFYKRSTDFGSSWSQDTCLSNGSGQSLTPCITLDGPIVHIVWDDDRDGNSEIYYKRSTNSGATWSQDIRLTQDPYGSHNPVVAVSGADVHVVWSDDRDSSHTGDIFYKRSTDSGVSWSADTQLTTDPHNSWYPSVSACGGDVYTVWEDNRDDNWEIYFKESTDSGLTWSADRRFAYISQPIGMPSISASGSNIYGVWEGEQGGTEAIYYKYSADEGASWSPEIRLTNGFGSSFWPSVYASGPRVHVVWEDTRDGNYEVYYKSSTDSGASWSSDTRLTYDPSDSWNASVYAAGPMVHVVWMDPRSGDWEIYYKRNPTGNTGVEQLVFPRLTLHASRLTVSPNPFTSFAGVPGHEAERFTLYDVSGRKVGTYKGDRIGEGLPAGVYFLRPEAKDAKPLRVVKLR